MPLTRPPDSPYMYGQVTQRLQIEWCKNGQRLIELSKSNLYWLVFSFILCSNKFFLNSLDSLTECWMVIIITGGWISHNLHQTVISCTTTLSRSSPEHIGNNKKNFKTRNCFSWVTNFMFNFFIYLYHADTQRTKKIHF